MTQDTAEGLVVQDEARGARLLLPPLTAHVWQHADGTRDVDALVASARHQGIAATTTDVWAALDQLGDAQLLEKRAAPPAGTFGRRSLLMRAAAGGLAAAAVTIVALPASAKDDKGKDDGEHGPGEPFNLGPAWSAAEGGYQAPSFRRKGDLCVLSGLVRQTGDGQDMLVGVLPSNCTPGGRLSFQAFGFGAGRPTSVRVDVLPDGQVVWAASAMPAPWLSLSGIVFSTAAPGVPTDELGDASEEQGAKAEETKAYDEAAVEQETKAAQLREKQQELTTKQLEASISEKAAMESATKVEALQANLVALQVQVEAMASEQKTKLLEEQAQEMTQKELDDILAKEKAQEKLKKSTDAAQESQTKKG